MLSYFPVAYEDELLYSLIARYAKHTGQSDNQKAVMRDVFGTQTAVAIPDLPSHLRALTERVRHVWQTSVINLIKAYTLGPFYLPFLQKKHAELVVESMHSDNGGSIHTRSGIAASKIRQPASFRFCPRCFEEQLNRLGEPYWRRIHHIPGLEVCIHHHCKLVETSLPFHPKAKHLYRSSLDECMVQSSANLQPRSAETRMYNRVWELLQFGRIKGFTIQQWSGFYQHIADELGMTYGSRVDHQAIREKVMQDLGSTNFGSFLPPGTGDDWLVRLFRKHRRSFHPLRHLLVWSSLLPDTSVEEIFQRVGRFPEDNVENESESNFVCREVDATITNYRKTWLKILNEKKGEGIKGIRSERPGSAVYAWLYRHDCRWLMAHRPPRIVSEQCRSFDHGTWDREVLTSLKRSYSMEHLSTKRSRLSRTYLIGKIPRSNSIMKHLDDLPLSRRWLQKNAESIEEYQLHRAYVAVKYLDSQNLPRKRWRILRAAGIRFESVPFSVESAIRAFERKDLN